MPITSPKVPDGLPELMRGLAKSVIKENPENIYVHAAEYFENLIRERDGDLDKGYKNFSAYKVYSDYKDKCREKGISVAGASAVVPQVAVSDGDDDDSGGSASAAARGKRRKRVRKQGSKDSNKSLEKNDSLEGRKSDENLAAISEDGPAQEESVEQPLVKTQAHKEFQVPKERSFGKTVSVDSEAAANAVSTVLEDTVLDSDDADRETGETAGEAEWENLRQPINCEDVSSYVQEDFGSAPSTAEVIGEVVAEPEVLVADAPPAVESASETQLEEEPKNSDEPDLSVVENNSASVEGEKEPETMVNGSTEEATPESPEKKSEEINQSEEGVDTVDNQEADEIVVEPRMSVEDLPDVPTEDPGENESKTEEPLEGEATAENVSKEEQESANDGEAVEEASEQSPEEEPTEKVDEEAQGEEATVSGEQSEENMDSAVQPEDTPKEVGEDAPAEEPKSEGNSENVQEKSSSKEETVDNSLEGEPENEDKQAEEISVSKVESNDKEDAEEMNEKTGESEAKSDEQQESVAADEKTGSGDADNGVQSEEASPQDGSASLEKDLPAEQSEDVENTDAKSGEEQPEENKENDSSKLPESEENEGDIKQESEDNPKPDETVAVEEDVKTEEPETEVAENDQQLEEINPEETVPSENDQQPEEINQDETAAPENEANPDEPKSDETVAPEDSKPESEENTNLDETSPDDQVPAETEQGEELTPENDTKSGEDNAEEPKTNGSKESSLENTESEQNAASKDSSAKESEGDGSSGGGVQEQEVSAGATELSISSRMGAEDDEEQVEEGSPEASAPPLEPESANEEDKNNKSGDDAVELEAEPSNQDEAQDEPVDEPAEEGENDSKNLQEESATTKQTSEEDEGSKDEVAEEPCIQRQVSPSTSKLPSKSHSVEHEDIKKVNLASFSKDSAEALFYSLKKTELESEEGPPNDPGKDEGEQNDDDDADVVMTEEPPAAPISRQQTKRSFTDDFLEKGPITEEAQKQAEGGGVAGDEGVFDPMMAAAARNKQLQEQMHARDDLSLGEGERQRKTSLRRSMTERVDLVRQDSNYVDLRKYDPDYVEEEDQFDGYYIGSIKHKILASSVSVADSDYFDPEQVEATVDDNNVQTALETIASTDTESTLPSQTTIQANRGFLKKSSQNTSSNIPYASFGNNAIDQSLDEFIEREEQNKEAEEQAAASKIQRSYRRFRSNKKKLLRDYHSTMQTCTESTESLEEYPNSIIQIKVDPKRAEQTDEDNSLEDARSENRRRPMYSLNIDEYDTAARRMTLTRGVALQRNSTPEEDSGKSDNASGEKKTPSEPTTTVATTEESPISSSERSDDKKSSSSGDEKENKDNSSSKSSETTPEAKGDVKQKPRPLSDGRKYASLDAQKLFLARQRTMPVQIDASVIRVLPKHMRKRNKSAGMIRK